MTTKAPHTPESLTMADGQTRTPIVAVNFTFAMDGGMWLQDSYGQRDWLSFGVIDARYGKDQREIWRKIAYHDGWCGMWYDVDTGSLTACRIGIVANGGSF